MLDGLKCQLDSLISPGREQRLEDAHLAGLSQQRTDPTDEGERRGVVFMFVLHKLLHISTLARRRCACCAEAKRCWTATKRVKQADPGQFPARTNSN